MRSGVNRLEQGCYRARKVRHSDVGRSVPCWTAAHGSASISRRRSASPNRARPGSAKRRGLTPSSSTGAEGDKLAIPYRHAPALRGAAACGSRRASPGFRHARPGCAGAGIRDESARRMQTFGLKGGEAIVTLSAVTVVLRRTRRCRSHDGDSGDTRLGHDFGHLAAAGALARNIREGRIGIPEAAIELDQINAWRRPTVRTTLRAAASLRNRTHA